MIALRRVLRWTLSIGLGAAVLLAILLALPVPQWRPGEVTVAPLQPGGVVHWPRAERVWIDTDAACGTGARRDPDDCLALLLLLQTDEVAIAGISTVFGNAPLAQTDAVTRSLVALVERDAALPTTRVARGCAVASEDSPCDAMRVPAIDALASALRAGPLTLLALGPLTNVAVLLRVHPELQSRIVRIVAVMGHRPGHRFHPSAVEDHPRPMLFVHGPLFRDLNVTLDRRAVREVLAAGVPLTLMPYEVARQVLLAPRDLQRIASRGRAGAWVAEASRGWLRYWQDDIGLDGFFPFDLLAAAHLLLPGRFTCPPVQAWLGRDPLSTIFDRTPALLVTQDPVTAENGLAGATTRYCTSTDLKVRELFE